MSTLNTELEKMMNEPLEHIDQVLNYVKKCIILTTKLLQIHPFNDGNGRSIRGLLNLMFKKANIPPIYVMPKEKVAYIQALQRARVNEDYNESDYEDIINFYYFKICDSLIEITESLNTKDILTFDEDGVRIYEKPNKENDLKI